jgi:hypothetical protein
MRQLLIERGGNGSQIFITEISQDQAGVSDEPVRSGADAIEVVPTDAPGEDDRSDELLKPVAFWCAVRQAWVEVPHECQDEEQAV